jgi:molybdopterin synthase sulfur carrier subunit
VEGDTVKRVRVDYYAFFREKRGVATEEVTTRAESLGELYCELSEAHGLGLPVSVVRVIVGDEFVSMGSTVEDGSRVVFVPPVAGG